MSVLSDSVCLIDWAELVSSCPKVSSWPANSVSSLRLVKIWDGNLFFTTEDRRTFACGANKHATLGLGHARPVAEPTEIVQLRNLEVLDIVCGRNVVFAITDDAKGPNTLRPLWAWGNLGPFLARPMATLLRQTPIQLRGVKKVAQVVVGEAFVAVLEPNGTIKWFGKDESEDTPVTEFVMKFRKLEYCIYDGQVVQMAAGFKHALFCTDGGQLLGYGSNEHNVLGGHKGCEGELIELKTKSGRAWKKRQQVVRNVVFVGCGAHLSAYLNIHGDLYLAGGRWKEFTKFAGNLGPMCNQLWVTSFAYADDQGGGCVLATVSDQKASGWCTLLTEKVAKSSATKKEDNENDLKVSSRVPVDKLAAMLAQSTKERVLLLPMMLQVNVDTKVDKDDAASTEPPAWLVSSPSSYVGAIDEQFEECHSNKDIQRAASSRDSTFVLGNLPLVGQQVSWQPVLTFEREDLAKQVAPVFGSSITWSQLVDKYQLATRWDYDDKLGYSLAKIWNENIYLTTDDDRVYAAGLRNDHGVLGLGHTKSVEAPDEIVELRGEKVLDIVCGRCSVFAITDSSGSNQLWAWGNLAKLMGTFERMLQLRPRRCEGLTNCQAVAVGEVFVLVLTKQRTVLMCGWDRYEDIETSGKDVLPPPLRFRVLNVGHDNDVVQIACGFGHAVFRMCSGKLYGFGRRYRVPSHKKGLVNVYQLVAGDGESDSKMVPVKDATWVAAGAHVSAYIDECGELWVSDDKLYVFTKFARNIGYEPSLVFVVVLSYLPSKAVLVCVPATNEARRCTIIGIRGHNARLYVINTLRSQTFAEAVLECSTPHEQLLPMMVKLIDRPQKEGDAHSAEESADEWTEESIEDVDGDAETTSEEDEQIDDQVMKIADDHKTQD